MKTVRCKHYNLGQKNILICHWHDWQPNCLCHSNNESSKHILFSFTLLSVRHFLTWRNISYQIFCHWWCPACCYWSHYIYLLLLNEGYHWACVDILVVVFVIVVVFAVDDVLWPCLLLLINFIKLSINVHLLLLKANVSSCPPPLFTKAPTDWGN